MFKKKLIISSVIFVAFLVVTSVVKNKTRLIEKEISNLNVKIFYKSKDINETQLEYEYLTTPSEIEKKLNIIGHDSYQPIIYSKIFFDISDFIKIQNKISYLNNLDEKKN